MLVTYELRYKGLPYRGIERRSRTKQKCKHVHMPESGDAFDRKHSQDQRKYAHRRLRKHQEFALVEAIRREACPRQQKQLRSKLQAHDNTNGGSTAVTAQKEEKRERE